MSLTSPVAETVLPEVRTSFALHDEIYVAGRWRQGSGPLISSVNPATGEVFATLHGATAADVDEAVNADSRPRRTRHGRSCYRTNGRSCSGGSAT